MWKLKRQNMKDISHSLLQKRHLGKRPAWRSTATLLRTAAPWLQALGIQPIPLGAPLFLAGQSVQKTLNALTHPPPWERVHGIPSAWLIWRDGAFMRNQAGSTSLSATNMGMSYSTQSMEEPRRSHSNTFQPLPLLVLEATFSQVDPSDAKGILNCIPCYQFPPLKHCTMYGWCPL